jgi:hypothetical protein
MKKISISSKPRAKAAPTSPDEWVSSDSASPPQPTKPAEKTKRLTIDIPLSLHQRVKSQCALKGEKMADVVRELLEEHFGQEHLGKATNSDPVAN